MLVGGLFKHYFWCSPRVAPQGLRFYIRLLQDNWAFFGAHRYTVPEARFSKVPLFNGPGKYSLFTLNLS